MQGCYSSLNLVRSWLALQFWVNWSSSCMWDHSCHNVYSSMLDNSSD
jgi:hypothetical protein